MKGATERGNAIPMDCHADIESTSARARVGSTARSTAARRLCTTSCSEIVRVVRGHLAVPSTSSLRNPPKSCHKIVSNHRGRTRERPAVANRIRHTRCDNPWRSLLGRKFCVENPLSHKPHPIHHGWMWHGLRTACVSRNSIVERATRNNCHHRHLGVWPEAEAERTPAPHADCPPCLFRGHARSTTRPTVSMKKAPDLKKRNTTWSPTARTKYAVGADETKRLPETQGYQCATWPGKHPGMPECGRPRASALREQTKQTLARVGGKFLTSRPM